MYAGIDEISLGIVSVVASLLPTNNLLLYNKNLSLELLLLYVSPKRYLRFCSSGNLIIILELLFPNSIPMLIILLSPAKSIDSSELQPANALFSIV